LADVSLVNLSLFSALSRFPFIRTTNVFFAATALATLVKSLSAFTKVILGIDKILSLLQRGGVGKYVRDRGVVSANGKGKGKGKKDQQKNERSMDRCDFPRMH